MDLFDQTHGVWLFTVRSSARQQAQRGRCFHTRPHTQLSLIPCAVEKAEERCWENGIKLPVVAVARRTSNNVLIPITGGVIRTVPMQRTIYNHFRFAPILTALPVPPAFEYRCRGLLPPVSRSRFAEAHIVVASGKCHFTGRREAEQRDPATTRDVAQIVTCSRDPEARVICRRRDTLLAC
ncbi:hypothetical protein BU24DRAFT_405464 [Aaosphaeria arxii CBS 175.79]|uniref:Uncharacterized protein n=1 Tax=Aaosphaeria arxii CBS 175.79 TaxID=1450172 RepID=A0A6A5XZH6_9PLEO|nr:uncharacterized protein BU24DRAFT_405464 [Aaosphaeria arxii CBS 175.79]KAF2018705.1 hypothetical protein BU24DRAFT_405464 [Aaosphaeria arxii CBS 175.79]